MNTLDKSYIKALLAQKLVFGETLLYLLRWKNERDHSYIHLADLGSSELHCYARQGGPTREQFEAWFRADAKDEARMTKIPAITAGDANFAPTMINLGARYPDYLAEKPRNFETIMTRLQSSRTDLSIWTEDDAQKFRKLCSAAINEPTAFPQFENLLGPSDSFVSARQLDMNNLENFGPGIGKCKPDICDGIGRVCLPIEIQEQLNGYIIPNNGVSSPCLPTWFMEVKGPTGGGQKAKDQAIRAGVLGERGVHRLRSQVDSPSNAKDHKAHVITATFSSINQDVDIYCVHRTSDGCYIMTELDSIKIKNLETYKKAAQMLRNGREWAMEVRESLLQLVLRKVQLDEDIDWERQASDEEQPDTRRRNRRPTPQQLSDAWRETPDEGEELGTSLYSKSTGSRYRLDLVPIPESETSTSGEDIVERPKKRVATPTEEQPDMQRRSRRSTARQLSDVEGATTDKGKKPEALTSSKNLQSRYQPDLALISEDESMESGEDTSERPTKRIATPRSIKKVSQNDKGEGKIEKTEQVIRKKRGRPSGSKNQKK